MNLYSWYSQRCDKRFYKHAPDFQAARGRFIGELKRRGVYEFVKLSAIRKEGL